MPAPIAYADRLANRTLCPSCAFTRIDMADSEESGPIMRYDLDPADTCPCDVCGTLCAPDNIGEGDDWDADEAAEYDDYHNITIVF
jgi:hypothetical protein